METSNDIPHPDSLLQFMERFLDLSLPSAGEVVLAMLLSLALNLVIARVYRSTYRGTRYSQDFVQALVIIGMVTTILIMVVSGNGAIAFGMFAAFSVIRFRRELPQARDVGFVFFAMSIGMVVGARFYGTALLITLIVSAAIWILTRIDAFAPERASHLLSVRVDSDNDFAAEINPVLDRFTVKHQLLRVASVQAGMLTELRYGIQLREENQLASFVEALQQSCGNNRVVIVPTGQAFDT
ncbi:DUF4956 domain-containing protein [Actomonas aquatica]|uniref:DUF4956 domain-containing protein n=1 Tax=Actomonas aquatica TaxID=2866162 RepID=A0ABZ1CBY0_9BACT|nr:DUF4956 domain-containing protein [Opitutus sp. WL0086]WRQ89155.1 DUF4956 domain-containing protein [Opitutus sp. WL0086]